MTEDGLLVLNVPYEDGGGLKSRGSAGAPDAIQKEIERWPWRQSEDGNPAKFKFFNIPGEGNEILENFSRVMNSTLANGGKKICVVMGDNSVSFQSAYELFKYEPRYSLFLFDRHPDCAPAVTEAGEEKNPHAYWLGALIGIGKLNTVLKPKRTLIFGIGDAEKEEEEFLKQHSILRYSISLLRNRGPEEIEKTVMGFKQEELASSKAIHVVIDVDVMTASEVPATGVPRGGGLTSGEMIEYIKMVKRLIKHFNIPLEIWNIAEARVDPEKDPGELTIINTASLMYEIAA